MLGLRAAGGLRGAAEDVISCSHRGRRFDFIGFGFFENYPKWCPQVVELEPLSSGADRGRPDGEAGDA